MKLHVLPSIFSHFAPHEDSLNTGEIDKAYKLLSKFLQLPYSSLFFIIRCVQACRDKSFSLAVSVKHQKIY